MGQLGSGASKTTIGEEDPVIRQISGVETSVPAFVVIAERGPVGVAKVLTSFEEYLRIFGKDIANGYGSHTVRGFFDEGGTRCWVSRTVHYTTVDTASTKTSAAGTANVNTGATGATAGTVLGGNAGPFDLTPNDTLVVTVDGGSPTTATFTATAASRTSSAETYVMTNGMTLTVSVDGGSVQTITFATGNFVSIGAATALEVAAVINAQIVGANANGSSGSVVLKSDKLGTASGINVTGGTANAVLSFTTGNTAGTGNVANIDAVTVAEVKTIVELAVAGLTVTNAGGAVRITSNTTGPSSSILVGASSTADDELGLDNATHSGSTGAAVATLQVDAEDGAYSSVISVKISAATSGVASEFDMQILDDGAVVGTFPNLTMDETADRYVETIANSTAVGLVRGLTFTDLAVSGSVTARRPANGTYGPLTGGSDGLASLADIDFIGSAAGKTGMYAFDLVSEVSMLGISDRATAAVHNAMISYCEVWRKMSMFPILDPPANLTAQQAKDYVLTTASLFNASEFGGFFWPRVTVLNPNQTIYGNVDNITVPPGGLIAGVFSRNDSSKPGGIYKAAAGEVRGRFLTVTGFETDEVLDERKRDIVYPVNINPLTTGEGQPRFIDGVRTLKQGGNFPSISERRGVIFIEQSIKRGIEFARHDNNDPELRRSLDRTCDNFLNEQMQLGAFRSKDPATAYSVDFDIEGVSLNTPAVVFANMVRGRIGLATQKPAEFIFIAFSQDTRAFDQANA